MRRSSHSPIRTEDKTASAIKKMKKDEVTAKNIERKQRQGADSATKVCYNFSLSFSHLLSLSLSLSLQVCTCILGSDRAGQALFFAALCLVL